MATVTERAAAPPTEGVALLVGRLLLAAIFLVSGFGKLTNLGGFVQYLAAQGVPAPWALGVVAACVEFFGGLAIAVGFRARWAALLMAAFTVVAALIAHRFWEVQDAAARMGQQNPLHEERRHRRRLPGAPRAGSRPDQRRPGALARAADGARRGGPAAQCTSSAPLRLSSMCTIGSRLASSERATCASSTTLSGPAWAERSSSTRTGAGSATTRSRTALPR